MNKYIGPALAAFRNYYGLTKTALAKKLNHDSTTITSIENGNIEPTKEMLEGYATLFGVFTNDFHDLALGLERSLPKVKNGVLHKNDVNNAMRAVKSSHEVTQLVLKREIQLAEFI